MFFFFPSLQILLSPWTLRARSIPPPFSPRRMPPSAAAHFAGPFCIRPRGQGFFFVQEPFPLALPQSEPFFCRHEVGVLFFPAHERSFSFSFQFSSVLFPPFPFFQVITSPLPFERSPAHTSPFPCAAILPPLFRLPGGNWEQQVSSCGVFCLFLCSRLTIRFFLCFPLSFSFFSSKVISLCEWKAPLFPSFSHLSEFFFSSPLTPPRYSFSSNKVGHITFTPSIPSPLFPPFFPPQRYRRLASRLKAFNCFPFFPPL